MKTRSRLFAFAICLASACSRKEPAPAAHSASAIAKSASPKGASWYAAGAAWVPAPALGKCRPRVAREPSKVWPGWRFSDCGDGCRRAPFHAGPEQALAAVQGSAARTRGDSSYVSLSIRILAQPTTFVLGTFEFGDGEAVALMAEDGGCFAQVAGRNAPFTYKLFPLEGETEYRFGRLDLGRLGSDRAITWLSPTLSKTLTLFDFDGGFGGIEAQRELWVTTEPTSAALTRVHGSSGMVRSALGERQPYWAESLSAGGAVMTRNTDGSIETLATGAWFPVSLGVSERRLVWLGASGAGARDGQFESAALYYCDRASGSKGCRVQQGPSLPIHGATGTLSTSGDRVALTGCSADRCDVYLVDLAASKAYRVRPREPELTLTAIGVSARRLVVAETSAQLRNTGDYDGLRSYALDRLGSFAEPL